jgi:hypothetical protein
MLHVIFALFALMLGAVSLILVCLWATDPDSSDPQYIGKINCCCISCLFYVFLFLRS